ncbi:hypothetical protein BDR26DRAFT_863502 [Obelidium mucronatum]|nr:hypothetical protein BDR26DRAFT_863502 [Obelidium mucronatum]
MALQNAVLSLHANCGDFDAALAHIKAFMENHGLQPNAVTFAHMIKAYGVAKMPVEAQKWFDVYRNSNEPTDDAPYVNLITAYANADDLPAAINVMSSILAEDGVPLTAVHLSAFMDALLLNNKHSQVIEWYNRLVSDKTGQFPKPNDTILDIAFEAAIHLKDEVLIEKLWPSSPTRSPNTVTLCLYGLSKLDDAANQNVATAMKVLSVLKNNKNLVAPALPAFFEALMRLPSEVKNNFPGTDLEILRVAASLHVFPRIMHQMLSNAIKNCGGDVKAAIDLYGEVSKFTEPGISPKQLLVQLYLDHGIRKPDSPGVELGTRDFEILMPLVARQPRMLATILDDMAARDVKMTREICDAVIEVLRSNGKLIAMNDWIQEMRKMDIIKGPKLEGEVMRSPELKQKNQRLIFCCKNNLLDEGMGIYADIMSFKMVPSISAMSTLIMRLFEAKRVDEAVQIATEMRERAQTTSDPDGRDYAIHDALMAGWITVDKIPEALECADYIIKKHRRLPFFRQISRIVSKTSFHHQSRDGKPELAPLELVGKSICQWLTMLPSPLVPTEVDPLSPVQAVTISDIIWILCKMGDGGEPQKALSLYYSLRDSGYPPRPMSHKVLLQTVAQSPLMDKSVAMELLDDAMEQLSSVSTGKFGFLDGRWFDAVLEMHLTRFNDLDSALAVWRVMKAGKFGMGQGVAIKLVEACLERGDLVHAGELFSQIGQSNAAVVRLVEQFVELAGDQAGGGDGGGGGGVRLISLKEDQMAFANLVVRQCGSVDHLHSQKVMEVALDILVKRGGNVVALTNWALSKYKSFSNSKLSEDLIEYMLRTDLLLAEALSVLESMSPFVDGAPNSRSLEYVSAVIYNATKLKDEAVAARGLAILESDGFTVDQVNEVKDGVKQIKAAMV